jgi:hypothetical protein
LLQSVSGLAVNAIETHFLAVRRRGIKSDWARDQGKPKVSHAGPF